jgi:hypothetical protein
MDLRLQRTSQLVLTKGSDGPGLPTADGHRPDSARVSVAVVSLALLALGIIGWGVGSTAAQATGFILFALVGFGSAWLIILQRRVWTLYWPPLALGPAIGLAIVVVIGFILVEARIWSAGPDVFAIVALGAAATHVAVLTQAARSRNTQLTSQPYRAVDSGDIPSHNPAGTSENADSRERNIGNLVIGLSIGGVVLCILSAAALFPFDPGPSGLFGVISPAWYVGFALILAAIVLGQQCSGAITGLPVVALVMSVTLTPALAYALPRYSWTAKHVGVTSYILLHGSVNAGTDIYQSWPGLFAGAAWLCAVSGIHDPMLVARWWPPVIDLVTVLAFQFLAFRVLGSARRAWLAAAIFIVGNTIGQDYFSPQSTAYLLAIAIFAIAFRHRRGEARGLAAGEWVTVMVMTTAMGVTHQLTPYMVVAALAILVLFGLARSRLLPIAVLLPALIWALLHLPTIKRYFNLSQLGDIASNALTRGLSSPGLHRSTLIVANSLVMAGDALIIGIIALIVIIRRPSHTHIALALCAASGAGLLVAQSYGSEGSFRVLLFALPWLAILAADLEVRRSGVRKWLWAITIPILLVAYLFADMGLDYINVVRSGDLQAVRAYESSAPKGSVLFVIGDGYAPLNSNGRYNLLEERYYQPLISSSGHRSKFDAVTSYQEFMLHYIPRSSGLLRRRKYYALTAQQAAANLIEFDVLTKRDYRELNEQFALSLNWRLVRHTPTASLYELKSVVLITKPPTISGSPQDGQTLTVQRGGWTSLSKLRFTYRWQSCAFHGGKCTSITDATGVRFKLGPPEIGHKIIVIVTAIDRSHHTVFATTAAVGPVTNPPPPINTSLPVVSGATSVGQQLTTSNGTWRSPGSFAIHYQWQTCDSDGSQCTAIQGAISQQLNITAADVGRKITVDVSATDPEGQASQVTAVPVGPIGNPPPPVNTALPTISGTPQLGKDLTADYGKWQSFGSFTIHYQWQSCDSNETSCSAIPGATSQVLKLGTSDVGRDITVVVTAIDQEGQSSSVTVAPVGPVSH